MRRRELLSLGGAALVAGCAAVPEAAGLEHLSAGGHVIYFRHGATDRRGSDHADWPRSRQRNLSEYGKLQARKIGEGFRARAIPVGEVRASPFHRCRDMGRIAFGRVRVDPGLLSTGNSEGNPEARVAYLRRLMSRPFKGPNLVLISHSPNILAAADLTLGEGEAAVIRPLGQERFRVVATVSAEEW